MIFTAVLTRFWPLFNQFFALSIFQIDRISDLTSSQSNWQVIQYGFSNYAKPYSIRPRHFLFEVLNQEISINQNVVTHECKLPMGFSALCPEKQFTKKNEKSKTREAPELHCVFATISFSQLHHILISMIPTSPLSHFKS